MALIPLNNNLFVDPDKVSIVRLDKRKNSISFTVRVDGENIEMDEIPEDFLEAVLAKKREDKLNVQRVSV